MATDQGVGGSNPLTHVAKESKSIAIMLLDFLCHRLQMEVKKMSAVIVLQQMLVLFSMIAIGVFLWKKNWIDVKGQKALSKMVVNIFNPLLLIYSISGYDFEKSTMNVGQNMVFVIVYFVLLFLMGFVVAFL